MPGDAWRWGLGDGGALFVLKTLLNIKWQVSE